MYRPVSHCRACQSSDLELVVDFGIQPLANDFRSAHESKCGHYPLQVLRCPKCSLAQLSAVVDPHVLYDRYSYITSTSETMRAHFGQIVNHLCAQRGGSPLGKMLEIGSNNGEFLDFSRNFSTHRVGVDPAKNLCQLAEQRGIVTLNALWNSRTAAKFGGEKYDTIVARHVFAHCDDWVDFIHALELVSHLDTVIFIEVPYARHLLEKCEFDTIYHEHLSYVTIQSIHALLQNTRFKLWSVNHYPIHGGSIGLVLRQRDWVDHHSMLSDCGNDAISREAWKALWPRVLEKVGQLVDAVEGCDEELIGYGAPAKTALWCNLTSGGLSKMRVVHDTTPQKQNTLIPGTNIPVKEYSPSLNSGVNTAVIWCWNFAEEVMRKEAAFTQRGGRFILPLGNK